MRWKKRIKVVPVIGTTKIVKHFAWFPTLMTDEATYVWLENYTAKYYYTEKYSDLFEAWYEAWCLCETEMIN